MENTTSRTNNTHHPRRNGYGQRTNTARIHAEAREAAEYSELYEKALASAKELGTDTSKEAIDRVVQQALDMRRKLRAQKDAERVPCPICSWKHDKRFPVCKRCAERCKADGVTVEEAIAKAKAERDAKAKAEAERRTRRAIEALTNERVRELLRSGKLPKGSMAEVEAQWQVVTVGHRTFRFIRDGYADELIEAARLAARIPCPVCGWLHNPAFPYCKRCAGELREAEAWIKLPEAERTAILATERHDLAQKAYEAFLMVEEMPEGVILQEETDCEVKFLIGNYLVIMDFLPAEPTIEEIDEGWDAAVA